MRYKELSESIKAYHGSGKNPQPAFDVKHIGHNSHTFGSYESERHGIFFTTNPKFAAIYGDVMEYDLNISNTYDMDENDSVIFNFLSWLKETENDLYPEARDTVMHQGHWHLFENEVGEAFVHFLRRKKGFDSAVFEEEHEVEGPDGEVETIESKTIVVFNPSKVVKQGQYELDLWEEMKRLWRE
jgi:hypothetical protein